MKNIITILLTLMLLTTIGLTACTGETEAIALENTPWVLESYSEPGNLRAVLEGSEITAFFDSGESQVNGSAGCNNYFISYEINNEQLSIISPIGSTQMHCESIMDQENQYLSLFGGTERFQIQDSQLHILSSGSQRLIFNTTITMENMTWVLESYGEPANLQDVLEGSEITALFDNAEGKVNGSAGCNNYFASYEINDNELSISDAGSTEMFCGEPEGVMEQENQYLALLGDAESFQIKDNQFQISSSDGQVLIFNAKINLEDTPWVLESYSEPGNLQDVLEGSEITASFDNVESSVNGSAGCNIYFASYEINNSKLSISDAGSTMMFCGEPEGVMEQEHQYLSLLVGAESFQIQDKQLHIFSAGNQVLKFSAQ